MEETSSSATSVAINPSLVIRLGASSSNNGNDDRIWIADRFFQHYFDNDVREMKEFLTCPDNIKYQKREKKIILLALFQNKRILCFNFSRNFTQKL